MTRNCRDCKIDVGSDYGYMVHDQVWPNENGKPLEGLLCIKCLEIRLGRRLYLSDFNWSVPLNYMYKGTDLLESRKNWPERSELTMDQFNRLIGDW